MKRFEIQNGKDTIYGGLGLKIIAFFNSLPIKKLFSFLLSQFDHLRLVNKIIIINMIVRIQMQNPNSSHNYVITQNKSSFLGLMSNTMSKESELS